MKQRPRILRLLLMVAAGIIIGLPLAFQAVSSGFVPTAWFDSWPMWLKATLGVVALTIMVIDMVILYRQAHSRGRAGRENDSPPGTRSKDR